MHISRAMEIYRNETPREYLGTPNTHRCTRKGSAWYLRDGDGRLLAIVGPDGELARPGQLRTLPAGI